MHNKVSSIMSITHIRLWMLCVCFVLVPALNTAALRISAGVPNDAQSLENFPGIDFDSNEDAVEKIYPQEEYDSIEDSYDDAGGCSSDPCENDGMCIDFLNGYECICTSEYVGKHCEIEIRSGCSSDPCENDGMCIDFQNGYECICTSDYVGRHCEIEIRRGCSSDPCENDGICIDFLNGYECICPSDYVGKHCETRSHCLTYPCKNGALCLDQENGYSCECTSEYYGKHCEMRKYQISTTHSTTFDDETYDFTVEFNKTTYEPSDFTQYFNRTTDVPSNFTQYFNWTTDEPSDFTQYFNWTTDEPSDFTHYFNWTTDEPSNFTQYFNWTTDEPSNFTQYFNWTTDESYNFTTEFNRTTYKTSTHHFFRSSLNQWKTSRNDGLRATAEVNGRSNIFKQTSRKPFMTTPIGPKRTSILTSSVQPGCNCGTHSYDCTFDFYGNKLCLCLSGYAQMEDRCVDCYCGEHSESCRFEPNGNKICGCSQGYTQRHQGCSKTCSKDSDCLNGGLCRSDDKLGAKFCQCRSNFRGDRCEVNFICEKLNPVCEAMGGVCRISGEAPVCECPPDKRFRPDTGFCEDICDAQKCLHGKCEMAGDGFVCKCDEGYGGTQCDMKL